MILRRWPLIFPLAAIPTPALADPISLGTLLATALSSLGVEGSIAGISLATIGGNLLAGAILTGVGIAISLLFAPKPPKPDNGIVPVQMSVPFRGYGYGLDRVAGALMFKEESGGYLGYVAALVSHRINAFVQVYLDDDQVNVPITSGVAVGSVTGMADGRYASNVVTIDSRKGFPSQTYYPLIGSKFPTDWPSSARGDGIASLAMVCNPVSSKIFSQTYPYVAPTPSAVLELALVFDPRDETQDPNNPNTWKYSDNAALAHLHFRCFSPFGSAKPYATAVLPRIDRWIAAINNADSNAALKSGGTEKRYRIAYNTTTASDRRDTEEVIRACYDGWTCDLGDGTIDVEGGEYIEPDVIITDADIISWTVQRGQATKDRYNRFTAKYKSPDNGFQLVETDPVNDDADIARRPGPPRARQIDLGGVPSTGQASRLLRRQIKREQAATRGTLVLWLSGFNAACARRIRIQSNTIVRLNNVVAEVSRPVVSYSKFTVTIAYIVIGEEIDAYDPATMESRPPPAPSRSGSNGPPQPTGVTVIPTILVNSAGESSVVLVVSWDLPMTGGDPTLGLSYQVRYMDHDGGDWVPQYFTDQTVAGARVQVQTSPVPSGVELDVEVGSSSTLGTPSIFSEPVTVSTDVSRAAPPAPLLAGFTATGGSGQTVLHCDNPNSSVFAATQFFRAVHLAGFGAAVTVGGPVYGVANGPSDLVDTGLAADTYDYWVASLNGDNPPVYSSPTGPVTATVT